MVGLYEIVFSTLSGDNQLQSLLGGTNTDKRIYPITHDGVTEPPAVRFAILSGNSDIGHPVDRPVIDLELVSATGITQLNLIQARIDAVVNRKRLSNANIIVHLCYKVFEADEYDPEAREYRRIVRYNLITS